MAGVSAPTKDDYIALAGFRRALRTYLRFVEHTARGAGVTPQQHQALLAIGGHPERDWASASEICDALQIGHNAVVSLIDRCQAAGLVAREPDETDRRVVRISLTEKGRKLLDEVTTANLAELRATDALTQRLWELTNARLEDQIQ